jgi:hypothetical protein
MAGDDGQGRGPGAEGDRFACREACEVSVGLVAEVKSRVGYAVTPVDDVHDAGVGRVAEAHESSGFAGLTHIILTVRRGVEEAP